MSGRGSGRRGKGGRGGAKRNRDDFERKITSTSESAEPAAPLPGGFKSMKAKWISFYENEQKAHESAPSLRPQSAADTADIKDTAAESKPQSSAPHSVTERWRKQRPPEAVKVPDKDNIESSSNHQSRPAGSLTEEKASSIQQPDPSAVPTVAIPRLNVGGQPTAVLHTSAAPALPEPPNSIAEGAVQAGDKAEKGNKEEAAGSQQPTAAQGPAGSSGPALLAEQLATAEPASASGLGPGRVAAMQDAAASYKAASKAHSSMQEALSPKRAEAPGRLPAPKDAAAKLNTATAVEAKTAALEPSMPSKNAAAPPHSLQQGQSVAVQQHVHAIGSPQSMAEQGRHPALDNSALHDATTGKLRQAAEGGSSKVDKGHQPKPEIKHEAKDLVIPSATVMRDPIAKEHKKSGAKERAAAMPGSESGPRQPKLKGQKGLAERQQGPGTGTKHSAASALKQPVQSGLSPYGRRAGQPGLSGQKAGQQAGLMSQPDPASRQGLKKALAPAKAAADGRVAEAEDNMKAEESIAGWRAQVQDTEIASNEPPAPLQPATGPAHVAEEASRQKGSDASSLEHSPDIPHLEQQQQQQRVDDAEAQGVEDQEQDALADSMAVTAHSQPLQLAPVEYLGEGSCASQQLGQIDLNQFDSYRALWDGLREDYGQSLPEGLQLRLVYEDGEGDFVMLQPDEPWPPFLSSARRVIISCQ